MKASPSSQPQSAEAKRQALLALISRLADDFRPIVQEIEASVPTTQDHYDRYMAALSQFPQGAMRSVVARALLLAGANVNGVAAAMRVI